MISFICTSFSIFTLKITKNPILGEQILPQATERQLRTERVQGQGVQVCWQQADTQHPGGGARGA